VKKNKGRLLAASDRRIWNRNQRLRR